MKKLTFILALILACGTLAACKGNSDGTTAPKGSSNPPKQSDSSKTPAKTTQKPAATKPSETKPGGADTTKPTQTTPPEDDDDQPKDELIDGTKFKVDGDLSDWEGLAAMKLQGEGDTASKSVTFYGVMTTTGLYMACDAYHDIYLSGQSEPIQNTYIDVCIDNSGERFTIYATGPDSSGAVSPYPSVTCQITESVVKTAEINDATKYHTIFEFFIATDSLPKYAVYRNTVSVGIGYRTVGDMIAGTQYAGPDGRGDPWGILGYDTPQCQMVATPKGLYGFDDYFVE